MKHHVYIYTRLIIYSKMLLKSKVLNKGKFKLMKYGIKIFNLQYKIHEFTFHMEITTVNY